MACQDIGEANPDIAGTGILLAFAIQGAIAVVLSIYSLFVGLTWQGCIHVLRLPLYYWPLVKVGDVLTRSPGVLNRHHAMFQRLLQFLERPPPQRTEKGIQKQKLVDDILIASSDFQSWSGIALLIAAFVQIRTNSLYQLHIIYDTASFVAISNCAAIAITYGPFSIKHLIMIIWSGLYLGYTIAFGIRLKSWNEDIPGQCYITSGIADPGTTHPYVDHIYISVTCLWVIVSLYGALGLNGAGFNSTAYGGRITLAVNRALDRELQRLEARGIDTELLTQVIPLISLLRVTTPTTFTEDPDGKQIAALLVALIQYPVHLYSIFMMRAMNESHLVQGSSEKDWGFGQVVAVILLGNNVVMLYEGIMRYRRQ